MLKKSNQKGFSIIEVLIVLAIAGLIMLIVFLAVPALQRNSRNTQRKNDASAYSGAINEWVNNHNGKLPVAADLTAINSSAKLAFYTAPTALNTADTASTDENTLIIRVGKKCDPANQGQTIASSRSVAVIYATEASSGAGVGQCIEG